MPYCTNCGAKLAENANFCHMCGSTIELFDEDVELERFATLTDYEDGSQYEESYSSTAANRSNTTINPNPESHVFKTASAKKTKRGALILVVALILALSLFFAIKNKVWCEHEWDFATCTLPTTCTKCGKTTGQELGHYWLDATCTEGRICARCDAVVSSALGHDWIEATCTTPKTCSVCNTKAGRPLEHTWNSPIEIDDWTIPTDRPPRICVICNYMEPLELPASGTVFIGRELSCESSLTINSKSDKSCYIKLKNAYAEDVYSFFVQAGDSIAVPVPVGQFYVYFSYGSNWYGTEHVFGPETTYAKDDELLDFENYYWEYTLYPTANGNFTETPIDPNEF